MPPQAASESVAAQFTACVRRAVAGDLPPIELIAAAEAMTGRGETALVGQLYKLWIERNPGDPLLHAIKFNYGVLLSDAGEIARAKEALGDAIRLRPDFLPPYVNLGNLLEREGALDQAVRCWLQVVGQLPAVKGEAIAHKTAALKQLGRVLEGAFDAANAEEALRLSLDVDPHQRDVAQHWIALRQAQCKWPVVAPWDRVTRGPLVRAMSPLSLLMHADDPMLQLANACQYHRKDVTHPSAIGAAGGWAAPEAERSRPLRVGYLSSDLRDHAIGFLSAEVYELHDRARVEVLAYYSGPWVSDATQARIRQAVDRWTDVTGLDDRQAARRIVEDGVDILVDLNGYTKDARQPLLALRPAPVIVIWLGFPGSLGSPHHHYVVADEAVIPPALERYYAEKVVHLPCYQPNDRRRVVAEAGPSRAEAGLPEAAFVYCCFNGTQKITAPVFARWMRILGAVPHAVLWLLSGGEGTDARLRELAAGHGVASERLVFASRMANPVHLTHYRLADLFLDTYPCGAHTTASDALWMGLPVLTLVGRVFASRVCGSLVRAAGLPELACADAGEYEAKAVALGNDRRGATALKTRLASGRDRCVLFDTPALVRRLEDLYEGMWDDYEGGRLPTPDLSNLEVYHEIGCGLVEEAAELPDAEYERRYLTALAYRDGLSPLPPDGRFWTGARAGG